MHLNLLNSLLYYPVNVIIDLLYLIQQYTTFKKKIGATFQKYCENGTNFKNRKKILKNVRHVGKIFNFSEK